MTVSTGAATTLRNTRTYSLAVSAWPAAAAMIRAESPPMAVARPAPSTVATDGAVELQPIVTLTGLPSESRAVAVYCSVAPRGIVSTARSRVTEATAPLNAVAVNDTGGEMPFTLAWKLRGPAAGPIRATVSA